MKSLAILAHDFGDGGVERMVINTCNGLAERGVTVYLLMSDVRARFIDALSPQVRLITLGREHPQARVVDFLREHQPGVMITAKLTDDALALRARTQAGLRTPLYFRVGNPLVGRLLARSRNPLRRWWQIRSMRQLYAQADGCIAVSRGIGTDLVENLKVPPSKVHVLPNPTVTPTLFEQARQTPAHRWFEGADAGLPVVLGIGGLRKQKNFGVLVQAFAQVRARRPCRLLILGDGRQRQRLLTLAARLGVGDDVDLPGWQTNPYAYMARASVFALSSLWEGSPNVLVEAAALGVPVVAADCVGGGARDILQDGRCGEIVPPNDAAALAAAISRALETPLPAERIREAATPFTVANSAAAYIRALGLDPPAG
ncbi:glycosyltransferase [Fontimonas sp. SYSU GA230001]|uniref:glycosyltransferase n=1 Tax=Fontimonas sp. SYSU GA230001 TaxID=3142450 RepID=UPI0032B5F7CA